MGIEELTGKGKAILVIFPVGQNDELGLPE